MDKGRRAVDPFTDRQQDAIRRLRVIDGTLAVRLGSTRSCSCMRCC
jgi:hypothetical protein